MIGKSAVVGIFIFILFSLGIYTRFVNLILWNYLYLWALKFGGFRQMTFSWVPTFVESKNL